MKIDTDFGENGIRYNVRCETIEEVAILLQALRWEYGKRDRYYVQKFVFDAIEVLQKFLREDCDYDYVSQLDVRIHK